MIFNIKENYSFINYTNLIFRTFVCVKREVKRQKIKRKKQNRSKKGAKNKEDSKKEKAKNSKK